MNANDLALDMDVEERVLAGARFLDLVAPGWWKEGIIDLDTLDLSEPAGCICGQVFYTNAIDHDSAITGYGFVQDELEAASLFSEGRAYIRGLKLSPEDKDSLMSLFGFNTLDDPDGGYIDSYAELQDAWEHKIVCRREGGCQPC